MIFEKVKEIIINQLGGEEMEITPNSSFSDDLGIDSLEIFEIVMSLEEAFQIEISNEDLEDISTVAQIVEYIEKKTK